MPLPAGSHCVRICPQATLGDDDEIAATCFVPHKGADQRPADNYLSMHWLEYLGLGLFPACLNALRDYLRTSTFPREFQPSRKGKLAVLPCDPTIQAGLAEMALALDFKHVPRVAQVAPGFEILDSGEMLVGIAPEQAAELGLRLDPHSGLFTLPEEESHRLAVQQFFASKVIHSEPGKLS